MLRHVVRNLVCLIGWLLADIGMIIANALLVLANYQACKVSFDLLGFDQKPLGMDELLGAFFIAFFSKATLAHIYALLVAVVVASGLFLVFHLAFGIYNCLSDRKVYLSRDDEQSAGAMVRLAIRYPITPVALAIPLAAAVH
jgi:hypothetical protein